jgi:hypothetical protein
MVPSLRVYKECFPFSPFFFVRVSVRKEGRETLIWGFESVDPCKVAS